jgi:hypothetical protein
MEPLPLVDDITAIAKLEIQKDAIMMAQRQSIKINLHLQKTQLWNHT